MPTYYADDPAYVPEIYLPDEIEAILAQARQQKERDYTLISMAINTGLRCGEIVKLTVGNVAPFGVIAVQVEVPAAITKTKRPRIVPLNATIRTDLERFFQYKRKRGESLDPTAHLFGSKYDGKPIGVRAFQRIARQIGFAAIGRPIHAHALRHTFATNILRQSNLRITQQLLGHRSIQSTQIYTHPARDELTAAVEAMAQHTG